MRFLVVGCGSIGKRHIRNLSALGVKDILAFDVREDRRREVEAELGVQTLDRLENAWSYSPEVALITTPPNSHLSLALQAARHGCRLFIEKPLSNDLEDVESLLETIREKNLITLVGCNMRFHPGLMKVKELIDSGEFGQITAARVEVGQYLPDWHPLEDYRQGYSAQRDLGGGVILDAIHELDYIRWMLGEVESVFCFAGKLSRLEIETEDTAAILLRFAGGAIGEIHLDYVQRAYSRSCHLIGDEGTIRWQFTPGEVRWYSAKEKQWRAVTNPPDWQTNDMYMDEMKHFMNCLNGSEQSMLDVFEGKRVLEVALAAKASSAIGKVVDLRV